MDHEHSILSLSLSLSLSFSISSSFVFLVIFFRLAGKKLKESLEKGQLSPP